MSAHDRVQAKASPEAVSAATPALRSASGLLQRKCGCGGSAGISGHCSECDKKQLTLQRQSTTEAKAPSAAPPIVDEVLRSPGQALDGETRAFMEPRFGHDFSRVRVHTDAHAAQSARAVNSFAYTVGKDIVFGAGAYEPNTQAGKRLLAHELTHVVQQGDAQGATTPRLASSTLNVSQPSDRAEQEANRGAEAIMSGTSLTPAATSAQGASAIIQRQTAAAVATPTPTQAPEKLEEKPPEATGPETKASHEGVSELSPIRQKLFELFGKFEKSVIGDEVFDKVETKEAWDNQKAEEAVASLIYASEKRDYDNAMKAWEAGGKKGEKPKMPVPVAKFTTCIATQSTLLRRAFKETGSTMKKAGKQPATFSFATQGAQTAEAIGGGAWHWGKMGMPDSERPKRGDIIVLAFRGGKVDEAAKQLNYLTNIKYGTEQKLKSNEAAKAKLAAAEEASAQAQEALKELQDDPKQPKWKLENAHNRLTRAVNSLNSAKKAAAAAASAVENMKEPSAEELAPAQEKLDTARKESAAARAERLQEPVGSKKRYLFQFSHVGLLQKIEKLPDGRERWTTFDGGQLVDREGQKIEGAQTSIRYYDPKSNEISGELQQGGEARWLYGWTDVDKLVADK